MNNYLTLTFREDKILVFEISDCHRTSFVVSVKKAGFNMKDNAKA
jgi:hypothetical protein